MLLDMNLTSMVAILHLFPAGLLSLLFSNASAVFVTNRKFVTLANHARR